MNQESSKGIIFGILGILTLIIAIMGASLAYFTAQAPTADEQIQVQSATVTITYEQGRVLKAEQLIPSSYDVVKKTYKRTDTILVDGEQKSAQCIDAKGYQVCSIFRFGISNKGGRNKQAITGKISTITDPTLNPQDGEGNYKEFQNLRFSVFKVHLDENNENYLYDEEDNIYVTEIGNDSCHPYLRPTTSTEQLDPKTNLPIANLFNHCTGATTDEETGENPDNVFEIGADEVSYFEIVVWLNETGEEQDEQGLSFAGEVEIGISGASSDAITGEYE